MNITKRSVIAVVLVVIATTLLVPVSVANAQSLDLSELECAVRAITPCYSRTTQVSFETSMTSTPSTTSTTAPPSAFNLSLSKIEADCQSLGELTELVLLADYQMSTGVLANVAPPRVSPSPNVLVPEVNVISSNPVRSFYFTSSRDPKVDSDEKALCQIIASFDWGNGPTYRNFLTCRSGTKFFSTGLFAPYPAYETVDHIRCNSIAQWQLPGFTTDMTYLGLLRSLTWTYRMVTTCGVNDFRCWSDRDFWQERLGEPETEASEGVLRAALEAQRAIDEAERLAAELDWVVELELEAQRAIDEAERALEEAQRAVEQARRASDESQRSADS